MGIKRRNPKRLVNTVERKLNKPGNEDFCSKRVRKIIYTALEAGLPIYRSIELAGVSQTQYHFWLRRGEERKNRKYYFFRKRVLQYKTQREIEALRTIQEAQKGGFVQTETKVHIGGKYGREITKIKRVMAPKWTAAAWWLERMYPEQYALKKEVEPPIDPREAALQIKQALNEMDDTVPEVEEDDDE